MGQDETVYIRYAGQTTEGTAWRRHYGDMHTKGAHFIINFLRATNTTCPDVINQIQIHEFTDATIYDMPQFHPDLVDKREQALIALFDQDLLLNTQKGGKSLTFSPDIKDENDFVAFRIRTIERMAL